MTGHECAQLERTLSRTAPRHFLIGHFRPLVGLVMLEQSITSIGIHLHSYVWACLTAEVLLSFEQEKRGQTRPWQDLDMVDATHNELLRTMVPVCLSLCDGQRQPALEASLIALLADRHWRGPYPVLRDKLQHTFLCMAVDGGLRRIGNESGFRVGR